VGVGGVGGGFYAGGVWCLWLVLWGCFGGGFLWGVGWVGGCFVVGGGVVFGGVLKGGVGWGPLTSHLHFSPYDLSSPTPRLSSLPQSLSQFSIRAAKGRRAFTRLFSAPLFVLSIF